MATPAFTLGASGLSPVSGGARQASPELQMEFERIVERGLPRFRHMAMRWLRNAEDAEDAVQDAMLSAFKHIAAFDGRSRLSTWVMAIVINSVRMQMRRRPRYQVVSLDQGPEEGQWAISEFLADPRPSPEQILEGRQLRDIARKLTSTLPESQRAAIQLRQGDGRSIKEAAQMLGIPQGTLKAQLARGRAKLVQRFQDAAGRPRTRAANRAAALKRKEYSPNFRSECDRCAVPVPIAGLQQQGGYQGWVSA